MRLMGLALVCVALQSPVPAQGQKTDVTEPAIQIIPSLTSEAVKNGETLGISVTLRAGAGVKSAAAVIEGIETIPLQPAVEAGGANADKSFGLWRAQWKAHGLEEKFYTVAIRVTDNAGRVAEDRSLFFSDPIAGIAVPGSPVYPSGGMRRVGRVILSDTNYSHLYCAVIDTNTGYALFTSAGAINPGRIIKVDLNGPLPVEVGATQAALGELNLIGGAYDPTTGYAYFGTTTVPGKVVKVRMEAGGLAPTYIGSITLSSGPPSENQTWGMVIDTTDADPANHYLYVACGTSPGIVVKVVPGIGAALPSRVAAVQLPAGINAIRRCAIDPANGYAYFATMSTNPAIIAKVALGAGASAPTYIGSATLLANESNIGSMVLDPANGYLYCGTYSLSIVPSRIIKVDVGAGASAPSRVAGITMAAGERELSTAVIDPAGGYAYFSCDHTHPARVYKIKLGAGAAAPSEAGVLQLATGTCGTACYPADGMNVT
ncbi:hypothetical protein HYR69_03385, partial [Candidatus Sumerlaeota bacterium]|nr:hypothetical protein [Candidatus Sumerlaeota bacterium]